MDVGDTERINERVGAEDTAEALCRIKGASDLESALPALGDLGVSFFKLRDAPVQDLARFHLIGVAQLTPICISHEA